MGHDHDFEIAENEPSLLVCINLSKKLTWFHSLGGSKVILVRGLGWEHLTKTLLHLLLVDETIPLRIHKMEQSVERLFEQASTFCRELTIFLNLWELFLKDSSELNIIEVTMQ